MERKREQVNEKEGESMIEREEEKQSHGSDESKMQMANPSAGVKAFFFLPLMPPSQPWAWQQRARLADEVRQKLACATELGLEKKRKSSSKPASLAQRERTTPGIKNQID